jgi:hypothetical protein
MAKNAKKNGKDKKGAAAKGPHASITENSAARASITRAKAGAALAGFVVVAIFSYRAGVEPFEVGLRALAAGLAVWLIAWAVGIALWRRIIVQRIITEAERIREEHEAKQRKLRGDDEGDEEATEAAA